MKQVDNRLTRGSRQGALVVGAAIGTGLAARAALRGGCDLLLALNAGKIRSMGAPSIAALLPLRDSNALVLDFGQSEVLPGCGDVPVFFGASSFDPRQPLEGIVERAAQAGFHGIANFPTSILLSGTFRSAVEAAGVGFDREVELLRLARARGLLTLAYVATLGEALKMIEVGVDVITLNFGWSTGGYQGAGLAFGVAEAGDIGRRVIREVRGRSPGTICLLEGGPIVEPEEMRDVCAISRADGYIGGSTLDRIPIEMAIEETMAAYKMAGALHDRQIGAEQRTLQRIADRGLIGWSAPMVVLRKYIARLARSHQPVLICGPAGSGKELTARMLAIQAGARDFVCLPCDEWAEESLFGTAAGSSRTSSRIGLLEAGRETVLFLDEPGKLLGSVQARLLAAIENGDFLRLGDAARRRFDARLVLSCRDPQMLDPRLVLALGRSRLDVPSLRDRTEDLPLLIEHFLKREGAAHPKLDRSILRGLLAYHWPGNVRELQSVLEGAMAAAGSGPMRPEHIRLSLAQDATIADRDERAWIVDALHRHRFRRGETAAYLGISRKTLYNKMQRFGIAFAG